MTRVCLGQIRTAECVSKVHLLALLVCYVETIFLQQK